MERHGCGTVPMSDLLVNADAGVDFTFTERRCSREIVAMICLPRRQKRNGLAAIPAIRFEITICGKHR